MDNDSFQVDSVPISQFNLSNVCRACLANNNHLLNLFESCSSEVFQYCTTVQISENDGLPNTVCQACLSLLNKLYLFKQLVIRSDVTLKHYKAVNTVKEEVLQDIDCEEPSKFNGSDIFVRLSHYQDDILDNNSIDSTSELERNGVDDSKDAAIDMLPQMVTIKKKKYNSKKKKKKSKKTDNGKSKYLKCPRCEKTFQKYEKLEAHIRYHFGLKPDIGCSDCGKKFATFNSLAIHSRTHTGVRKYQCLACGKKFSYLSVLINHEKSHAGDKKYFCHLCDAKFVQPSNLKTHLLQHTGEKLYPCVQCGRKFIQPGNLKIHMIRHSGIKNFACTLCDRHFYVKGDLDKHMKSHSDDKPHCCKICGKCFKSQSFLQIHIRTHTGERPFACDFCPMKFMAQKDRKNHQMIHTGEKPHKCKLCCQAFIQKSALNRHMRTHNKGHPSAPSQNAPAPESSLHYLTVHPVIAEPMQLQNQQPTEGLHYIELEA